MSNTNSQLTTVSSEKSQNPEEFKTETKEDMFQEISLQDSYDFIFVASIFLDAKGEYFSGGAEIHLRNICQTLQRYQKSAKILVIQQNDASSTADQIINKNGLDILKIKADNKLIFRWKLAKTIKKINTKRVHFNYIGQESFIQKKAGVIYSATFHGTCWDFPTSQFPQKYIANTLKQSFGSKFVKWNYIREQRRALHWFDRILSVDTSLTRFAQMFLYEKSSKVEVAYNFVDLEKFYPGPDFQAEKFTILYPRNISFARGVHLLVPIANYLKNQGIDFVIKMVGAGFDAHHMGKYEQVLHQEIKESGLENYFDFVGRIPHEKMPELFKNCHLAIVPTYFSEGTSLSCLEAMASGKPVVVSNIGGLSDLIIDKHNGFISSPEAVAIAKNIEYVYQNYDKMGEITQTALKIVTQNNSLKAWEWKVVKFFE